jgi:hypothetical protein
MSLKMRRGISILLVLVFALAPLAFTLDASGDAGLPACCRRHGAHHCIMRMAGMMEQAQKGSTPAVSAPLTCPFYPGPVALTTGPAPALASRAAPLPALIELALARAAWRTATPSHPATAHAGRGPPNAI